MRFSSLRILNLPLFLLLVMSVALSQNTPATSVMPLTTLLASNGASGDSFGATAISSGDTIAIGAPEAGGFSGAIYVFVEPQSGWQDMTQTAELTASSSSMMNLYAFSGDTILGGQLSCTGNGNFGPGALYVYVKPTGGWSNTLNPTATLQDGNPGCIDHFVDSATMNETQDIIVAGTGVAPKDKVFIFAKPAGGWTNMDHATTTLSAPPGAANFGSSLAINGNLLAVGADDTNPGGAVYLFQSGPGGALKQIAELTPSDGDTNPSLGYSLAMTNNTIVVGAITALNLEGKVYVYVKPATGWTNMTETAQLTVPNLPGDFLGVSVATDRAGENIVTGYSYGNPPSPVAYSFHKPADGWQTSSTPTLELLANDQDSSGGIGTSVNFANTNIVVGAGSTNFETGAAFVFGP